MSARTHELKTDPEVFEAVARGAKTHEIRLNDRNFKVGDILHLRETQHSGADMRFSPKTYPLAYTGRQALREVSHVQTGYGLLDGWCILSFAAPRKWKIERQLDLGAVYDHAGELIARSYYKDAKRFTDAHNASLKGGAA